MPYIPPSSWTWATNLDALTDVTIATPTNGQALVYETSSSQWKNQTVSWSGDMVLASTQTNSGLKTFLDWTFGLRNVANTFTGLFTNTITTSRTWTLPNNSGTIALLSDLPAWVLKLPTYTVASSGADFTDIQSAIDAATLWWIIYVLWTYTLSTWLKWKNNYTYIVWNGEWQTVIQYDGATVATAISPNTTSLKQCWLSKVLIKQTNVTVQWTAIDISNMALMNIQDVQVLDSGLTLKMDDTVNNTFYNSITRVMAFWCNKWVQMTGTTPANHNYFTNCRFANNSGGTYGTHISNGQGNIFTNCSFEPVATTGNTWVYLTSANTYSNEFHWCWIEGNNVWVLIDSTVTYNKFDMCTITSNTTNVTDNGKYTLIIGQVGSNMIVQLPATTITENGNASSVALLIRNNTSFAHVANSLVNYKMVNATDTSDVLRIDNAWNGAMVKLISTQGTLQTASDKWDLETDTTGKLYYSHNASERGVVDAEQYISLTTAYTLTSQTAAQKLFNTSTNGALTVKGATSYMFECFYSLSAMSATSGSFGFALWGTATLTSIGWTSIWVKWALTAVAGQITYNTTASQATLVTATTTTTGYARITWTVRINAGGTIIPQVSLGVAAAAVVGVNSYFRIWAIGTNTDTRVGNWS